MDEARHSTIGRTGFGCIGSRGASLYVLQNDILKAAITDYGGILVSLEAPDCAGRRDHVVLGFDDVAVYAGVKGSFGALLGRNANRIAGGSVTIDGETFSLSKNENGSTLHGGAVGFGKQFWSVTEAGGEQVCLALTSPDGDQGFPGEVHATATYRLEGPALHLVFDATATKPTPLSMSAHPYFNLDGVAAFDCLDHRVEIDADAYLPTDDRQIPTGEVRAVTGTAFDFTAARRIGERIREPDPQLRYGRGYDHYFVLPSEDAGKLRRAVCVGGAKSGRTLEILTTQRGIQFYSGNNLDGSAPGRGGLYRQSAGFAVEPQGFPNAPNQPNFPTTILRPGERYHEETVYRFGVERAEAAA